MDRYEIFDKFLTGELTDTETDLLMDLLSDEEIGKEFVEYSLETKLFVECGKKVRSKMASSKIKKIQNRKPRKSYLPMLITAAVIAVSFFGYRYFTGKNKVKLVKGSEIEVYRNGSSSNSVKEFKEGDVIKSSKESTISLEDGSKILISKDTELEIRELILNKVLFLRKGKIAVDAVHQELGVLKVLTTDSETEVVGTAFTVQKLNKGTLLEVNKGTVNFSNSKESLKVSKGTIAFTNSRTLVSRKITGENDAWLMWSSLLNKDKSLLLHVDFQKGRYPGKLLGGTIEKGEKELYFLRNGGITLEETRTLKVGKSITLFAWFKARGGGGHCPVFTKGESAWRMQINLDKPHIGYGSNQTNSFHDARVRVKHGEWYLLHQVITANKVLMYLNGALISEEAVTGVSLNNELPVMIGGNVDKEGYFFPGDIGEAGLFDRPLPKEEIQEMFEMGKYAGEAGK